LQELQPVQPQRTAFLYDKERPFMSDQTRLVAGATAFPYQALDEDALTAGDDD
jgi:hypothetical protein